MRDKWFPFRAAQADPRARLLCIPPAGKGCSVFRAWQAAAPEGLEVLAVQFPGRETRLQDEPVVAVEQLADQIVEALRPYLDVPLAIFGHCLGAVVAYEVGRRLPEGSVRLLSVSSCKPPHLLEGANWTVGGRSQIEIIRDAYGDAVADLPAELLDELLPGLMADLIALDAYVSGEPERLPSPVLVFHWSQDHTVSPADLERWRDCTSGGLGKTLLDADRELLAPEGPAILAAINGKLTDGSAAAGAAPPRCEPR